MNLNNKRLGASNLRFSYPQRCYNRPEWAPDRDSSTMRANQEVQSARGLAHFKTWRTSQRIFLSAAFPCRHIWVVHQTARPPRKPFEGFARQQTNATLTEERTQYVKYGCR